MSRPYHKFLLLILAGLFLPLSLGAESPARRLNLYILEFENLRSDPSLTWLSHGFADMLGKSFDEIDGVSVYGRKELEALLQDRSTILRQPGGTRNLLMMGTYVRNLDQLTVDVQLIDIASWEEIAKVSSFGLVKRIPALGNDLFKKTADAMTGYIPPSPKRGILQESIAAAKPPEYQQQVKELGVSMSSALKKLEESMDVYIGAREKVEDSGETGRKFTRQFSFAESNVAEGSSAREAQLLEDILSIISNNPYQVDIQAPVLSIVDEKSKQVRLMLPIKYSLKENLINDLLSSLPYTATRQDGNLTTLEFSRKKFPIPADLTDRISRGEFRVVPVIQLLDVNGEVRTVILDTPEPSWHTQSSEKVRFITEHVFSPLIVFTVGGWSMQVTMESVDIEAEYEVDLSHQELASYSKVTVEFVPEIELSAFLDRIL